MNLWIERFAQVAFAVVLSGTSVMVLAVILERLNAYKRAMAAGGGFRERLRECLENAVASGDSMSVLAGLEICGGTAGPEAAVAAAGLRRYRQWLGNGGGGASAISPERARRMEQVLNEAMQEEGDRELSRLEEHLPMLSTLGTTAPLMGFLGTVAGMIIAFQRIASAGMGKPQTVAGGISTALVTTAAGLVIAIPALAMHNYFANRVKVFVEGMNETASMVVRILVTDREEMLGA